MSDNTLLQQLIDAFRCLPGVGVKTAQRMAFHVLERDREGAARLSACLRDAIERIDHCRQCRTLTEHDLCSICASHERQRELLCVVETPAEVMAIEQNTDFKGLYHVLMGKLSPLDGIGPTELGLDRLESRFDEGGITEVIMATNSTVEGDVTAHVISGMAAKRGIRATRIAQGIPAGGELEYLDSATLTSALSERREY